jgi:hypothetical protein
MKKIESYSYKIARRGEDPPSAFQQPYDRPDPYKRYRGTNSGAGYNLTTLFSGPLAGEPESLGWSAVSPTKSVQEGFNTKTHPLSENGDPEQPFNVDEESDSSSTQYGDGDYSVGFFEDSSPLSRNNQTFNKMPGRQTLEQQLKKTRGTINENKSQRFPQGRTVHKLP